MIEIDANIQTIGIVGAGVMGSSVANVFASNGYRVILNDLEKEKLEDAVERIEVHLAGSVSRKKISSEDKEETLKRIRITPSKENLTEVDLIVEVVDEDLSLKQAVMKELGEIIDEETIVTTNTNSLSITEIASAIPNPSRVVGMHFFNPSESMKLVEITYGKETSKQTAAIIKEVVKNINKEGVIIARDTPGHIVNRILVPFLIEAIQVYEEGIATKEDIDKAVRYGLNHPMGPFELQDYIGLDVCCQLMEDFAEKYDDPKFQPPNTLKELIKEGYVGQKVGKGYYTYKN